MSEWKHFTARGKMTAAYYAIRRIFVSPAPTSQRCFMGSVVHPDVWCPRRCGANLWCRHHRGAS